MSLPDGARLGPYEVVARLGSGGMGEVYRARDTRLGRHVAVKVLPAQVSADPERLGRFEHEARAASALNHPNIVTIHDVGREGDAPWLAMELVQGRTLRALIGEGPLSVADLVRIASQVAEGLAAAHAEGIVHRDLKPENVMVTDEGVAKILDFGLAKLAPETAEVEASTREMASPPTRPGTVLGTVGYMSPEQAAGKPVDFRSDQFALGAILYEMITGRRAFRRDTAVETLAAILRDQPPALADARLPLPLVWVVDRCLAKDARNRYASTRDLARDLRDVRDHMSSPTGAGRAAAEPPVPAAEEFHLVRRGLFYMTSPRRWWEMDALGCIFLFFPLFLYIARTLAEWVPGTWGQALAFGIVLCQALSIALRVGLVLIAVTFRPAGLAREVRRLLPWIRGGDLGLMIVLLLAAGTVVRDHAVAAGVLLVMVVAGFIRILVVEPTMVAAAFPPEAGAAQRP